jgi:heme/copper-type cytochrome/quinol oxidase subunit 4
MLAWVICFCAAKHLLMAFEEELNRPLSHLWALFAAELTLILTHWHIVYANTIPQIALILSIIGYALALGYYLLKTRGLSNGLRQQLLVFSIIIIAIIIVFTEWQSETF